MIVETIHAAAPVADAVELHAHAMDGGMMKMRKVERAERQTRVREALATLVE